MPPNKEGTDKTSENELTRTEGINLLDKWFKVMITKILNKLRRRMDKQSENFNRVKNRENVKKNHTE